MSATILDQNAEDILYATLIAEEQKNLSSGDKVNNFQFIHCRFFHTGITPDEQDKENFIKALENANDGTIFICNDNDIIFKWNDDLENNEQFCANITKCIFEKYAAQIENIISIDEFFVSYDFTVDLDELKSECFKKMRKQTKQAKALAKYFSEDNLIATLGQTVQLTSMQRMMRAKPQFLIVEDQIFSQKMLTSILNDYTCHIAESVGEALLTYIEKCPDVVLLDIDLPDLSGHTFAKLVNKIDSKAYIIMVSANQYQADINKAKENNVKGFIAKPYKKEAILKVVDKYLSTRKKGK